MKKFFLTGSVLLAFAAASYAQSAQNTSTVNQVGNKQSATASQSGSSLTSDIKQTSDKSVTNEGNYAETQQSGQASQAFINQIGSQSGYVKIQQEKGTNGANKATVNQKNNSVEKATVVTATTTADDVTKAGGNHTLVSQSGSSLDAIVNQNNNSKGNVANTSQVGSGNKTTVSQSDYSTNNTADVVQGTGSATSANATATIEQDGLKLYQGSTGNKATIKQLGVSGKTVATIHQNASTNAKGMYSTSNQASIAQTRDGNVATIDQNNSSINNAVTITQDALNGTATVTQSNNAASNIATLKQVSGNKLKVSVNQNGKTDFNQATTTQYGNGSEIAIEQKNSNNNQTTINQGAAGTISGSNKVRTYQNNGSQNGEITISQNVSKSGLANDARIEQSDSRSLTERNKATLTQEGSRNSTNLLQTGAGGNAAMISQTGNNNIVQGSRFTVGIPGFISISVSSPAIQDGDGNKMTVAQTSPDGLNTSIFNTANLFQSGTNNTLNLSQTATTVSNVSTISQTGTSNVANVTQLGNGAFAK